MKFLTNFFTRRRVTTITEDLSLFHAMREHARRDQAARRKSLRRRLRLVVIGKETHVLV